MKKNINNIEVVDKGNRPIGTMPPAEVHRQSLRHRSVVILIYDSEGKLYLQKRNAAKKLYAGRWNISASGHVFAGESCESAALRQLEFELGIKSGNLQLIRKIQASSETGYEFITVYALEKINTVPSPNPDAVESGYFYTDSELEWLIKEYRELLTPTLVFLHDENILFVK